MRNSRIILLVLTLVTGAFWLGFFRSSITPVHWSMLAITMAWWILYNRRTIKSLAWEVVRAKRTQPRNVTGPGY